MKKNLKAPRASSSMSATGRARRHWMKNSLLSRRRLGEGFRSVLPMTLMAMGEYQDPDGCYMPSILH
jgi:hypothetical protein